MFAPLISATSVFKCQMRGPSTQTLYILGGILKGIDISDYIYVYMYINIYIHINYLMQWIASLFNTTSLPKLVVALRVSFFFFEHFTQKPFKNDEITNK